MIGIFIYDIMGHIKSFSFLFLNRSQTDGRDKKKHTHTHARDELYRGKDIIITRAETHIMT